MTSLNNKNQLLEKERPSIKMKLKYLCRRYISTFLFPFHVFPIFSFRSSFPKRTFSMSKQSMYSNTHIGTLVLKTFPYDVIDNFITFIPVKTSLVISTRSSLHLICSVCNDLIFPAAMPLIGIIINITAKPARALEPVEIGSGKINR